MKIYIEEKILEYRNNREEINTILEEVDNLIEKKAKVLSYMIIDDVEIYEGFYDYFWENIKDIEEIKIVTLTYKEFANEILISSIMYIERTPDLLESLADRFYKNPNQEAWSDLNNLIEGITWIVSTFEFIDQDERLRDTVLNYEDWNLYAKELLELKEILKNLENALSNEDSITIADILSYEIISIFKKMSDALLNLVNMEANLYDLN